MDGPDKESAAFFNKQLNKYIKSYKRRRAINRACAFGLRMLVTLCGSATTVLLGLKGYHPFNIQEDLFVASAFITSAMVTLLAAWEIFFDHRWLWILYTRTVLELNEVHHDFTYQSTRDSGISREQLDGLYSRFHRIIEDTNVAWTEKRRRERMPGDAGVTHESFLMPAKDGAEARQIGTRLPEIRSARAAHNS